MVVHVNSFANVESEDFAVPRSYNMRVEGGLGLADVPWCYKMFTSGPVPLIWTLWSFIYFAFALYTDTKHPSLHVVTFILIRTVVFDHCTLQLYILLANVRITEYKHLFPSFFHNVVDRPGTPGACHVPGGVHRPLLCDQCNGMRNHIGAAPPADIEVRSIQLVCPKTLSYQLQHLSM